MVATGAGHPAFGQLHRGTIDEVTGKFPLAGPVLAIAGAIAGFAPDDVHAGDGTLSPGVARRLIALVADDGGRREDARARLESLSAREREVACAVGRGCANAEIAAELHMSVATVKAHVSRLLVKLGVENRVQVALLVQDAA